MAKPINPPHGGAEPKIDPSSKRRSEIERHERVSNERALVDLVVGLARLRAKDRVNLGLPEEVLDALLDAQHIKSAPAVERHNKFVRGLLRGLDWQEVARKVDLLRAGFEAADSAISKLALEWCHQLVVQGDVALHRFLERFPEGDRRRLRQLAQNVIKAPEPKRAKARHALEQAVEGVVRNALAREEARASPLAGEESLSTPDDESDESD